ncbi:hypothetical protein Tco_0624275 [Tanacetum coccineum]|uniref:Uncharacterized protein n=1 Tax=Tanacetum coccineum TaxID=301880 RepID=A0ABQ4WDH3_9ASTR
MTQKNKQNAAEVLMLYSSKRFEPSWSLQSHLNSQLEEERRGLIELKKNKAKGLFEETYFSCSRKKINDEFLKGLCSKGFEKERRCLKERDAIKTLKEGRLQYLKKASKSLNWFIYLYRVVDDYYEHIPPTGLGLALLGDLNIIWETDESSDDDFWKDQEEWEIIRWRFHESSGVHTLEIEDGTMIHMLAERRYPLSRELMIRMLDHGMEVAAEI